MHVSAQHFMQHRSTSHRPPLESEAQSMMTPLATHQAKTVLATSIALALICQLPPVLHVPPMNVYARALALCAALNRKAVTHSLGFVQAEAHLCG